MVQNIFFDPLVPHLLLYGAMGFAVLVLAVSLWRGLPGWAFRGLAALALLVAIANPSLQQEEREPLDDIVLALVDESASQTLGDRAARTRAALADLREKTAARAGTVLAVATIGDATDDRGTLLAETLAQALADIPPSRLAGVVVISDGVAHDAALAAVIADGLSAPLHLLLTGHSGDRDRRISLKNAPGFAILGESLTLTIRVDDLGAGSEPGPAAGTATAAVLVSVDGGPAKRLIVPVGRDVELPLTLAHGGMNTVQFSIPVEPWELTGRNNTAILRINGVRDRLRVLLVSGEPHPGERTWRNLLKSDSSVDLVHFTILRPPEKQDGVPVDELSLIAFPTRELFLDKVDEFDLIIFDRYKRRGILPGIYLASVRDYVLNGGAVLLAAGPDYATADSLWHSDLADILPAAPTARVIEQGYTPLVSALGARHPVTRGLEQAPSVGFTRPEVSGEAAPSDPDQPGWGRWLRLTELRARQDAQVVMTGLGAPLLVLNRAGNGRVALLGSDHSWLWARGYEGGGPQAELLRRLAHWMMKEPDLEEERLFAEPRGLSMLITRQSLGDRVGDLEVTTPSGEVLNLAMTEAGAGLFTLNWEAPEPGLYRLREGDAQAVVALGPASPLEFVDTIATAEPLSAAIDATRGGVFALEDGMPDLRNVRPGRKAFGRGWIGLTPRNAWRTTDVTLRAILPTWAFLLLIAGLMTGAWLYEGRR